MIGHLLPQAFAAASFAVTVCQGAAAGLERLRAEPFDLLLTDLNLPGMTGMELLEATGREFPDCVVVVITGSDDVRPALAALRRGAYDYLVKPLDPEMVLHSVERALQKKRTEVELDLYRRHLELMVADRTRRLEESAEETIRALGAALDLRDTGTSGHSQRVCLYAAELARAMGWGDDPIKDLMRGAFLHDIGKMAIPDAILMKPGALTTEERLVMQTHVRVGHGFVSNVSSLKGAAEVILHHHERFDGKGYPQGLRGEAIPIQGRIFSVVDAFDAMTSQRPYRRPLTYAAALAELQREAGTQFDPAVVAVFKRIPEATWRQIRQPSDESKFLEPAHGRDRAALPSHPALSRQGDVQ